MNADITVPVDTPDTIDLGLINLPASAVGMLLVGPTEVADQACQGCADQQGNHWFRHDTPNQRIILTTARHP